MRQGVSIAVIVILLLLTFGMVLSTQSLVVEGGALAFGLLAVASATYKLIDINKTLRQEIDRLKEKVEFNEYRAYHDALTKLKNRYYFDLVVEELDAPHNLPLSVILADVDNLKVVNDKLGHWAGDALLIKVADVLRDSCRKDDIVIRWGGDEFVILLPRTDAEGCAAVQSRIRQTCANSGSDCSLSISMGAATKVRSTEDLMEVLRRADRELYKQKSIEKQPENANSFHVS